MELTKLTVRRMAGWKQMAVKGMSYYCIVLNKHPWALAA